MSKKSKKEKSGVKVTYKDGHYSFSDRYGYDIDLGKKAEEWKEIFDKYAEAQKEIEVLYKKAQQAHYDSIK